MESISGWWVLIIISGMIVLDNIVTNICATITNNKKIEKGIIDE